MSQELLSVSQAGKRLGVSEKYVHVLVTKQGLVLQGNQFIAQDVDKLAQLMNKLRQNGIATLVDIVAANKSVN